MVRKEKIQELNKLNETVPINLDRIRQTTEVLVKEIPREQIETIEKKGKVRKTRVRKETPTERVESKVGSGYILIITEKPQAAAKLAAALGNERKLAENGVPYYELTRGNKKIVVACAVGHLFGLKQAKGEKGWPVYNINWNPVHENAKNSWSKKYYSLLVKLVKGASEFIVATDYDIEGEVIGYNIIRFIAKQHDAKRMKFSSLTKPELEEAYNSVSPTLNWGLAIAGETRHYLDWMYGINLSRALMEAIKSTGSFRIMSIGRVQGPALHFIVEREREIQAFKPTPYWQVFIIVEGVELKYNKDITKQSDLIPLKGLKGKQVMLETRKSEQSIKPPAPFDLTSLQTEAYKFYSITPSRTLQIAQGLYLGGLISYPRTSSQKIPEAINPQAIIKKLSKAYDTDLCTRAKPVEGSKSDPAHPSIYPTGEYSSLQGEEKKIYDLIVRRFLSCFCEDAIVANKVITALYKEEYKFIARGLEIIKKAWLDVYKQKMQERELPDIEGLRTVDDSRIEEKMTQPPNRYSPASLVRELEKKNLGTKATRAAIVETLYNRGYIQDQSIKATPIGMALISSLEKHSPVIIDEKLTREFEKEMDKIQEAKSEFKNKEDKIIRDAKKSINDIAKKFKEEEKEIGSELLNATNTLREQERKSNELQVCPKCGKAKLRIIYGKRFKRYFVACSAYPECKTTFSLPPNALIKPSLDKEGIQEFCEKCQFPYLLALRKGRRPWKFCFNPDCPSRDEYNKRKAEKAEQEENEKEESEG